MNKMKWEDLRAEINSKTECDKVKEIPELLNQIPCGEFVAERINGRNIDENYRLLREFLNCDHPEFDNIHPELVLLKNGKEIKVGDSIYTYNSKWSVFIGVGTYGGEFRPFCIYLNRGIGFSNPDTIRVGQSNDAGEVYEIRKREDIPTDLHTSETMGYKTKYQQLKKDIINKIKRGYCGCINASHALKTFNSFDFSYEELQNFKNWSWHEEESRFDSWYGNDCITDEYVMITLDTTYFKYSNKIVTNTYGYEY